MRGISNFYSIGEKASLTVVATGTDIWDGPTSTITIPPSGGEQMELFCANANDTAGGTGIREVRIHYLDSAGVEQITDQITNGGAVDLSPSDVRFIQTMHAISVGSNGVSVGQISVRSKATPSNVYQVINSGGNMSLCINKMIPANKTFYLSQWYGSASGKQPVTLRLRSTDHNNTLFIDPNPVFLFKDTASIENSSFSRSWTMNERIRIPSLSILKASAWTDQAGATVSVGFSGELKDNA